MLFRPLAPADNRTSTFFRIAVSAFAFIVVAAAPLAAQDANAPAISGDAAVRPGDGISVRIWDEPLMSDTFFVSETGRVILPKLGEVPAAGRHPEALRDSLRSAYSVFLTNPSIDITVLRRIGVLGEVTRPGLYFADPTMTLSEIIAMAGGVTQQGDIHRISVLRDGQEHAVGAGSGPGVATVAVQSGDQVVVGRRNWFELNLLAIAGTAAVLVSVMVPLLQSLF